MSHSSSVATSSFLVTTLIVFLFQSAIGSGSSHPEIPDCTTNILSALWLSKEDMIVRSPGKWLAWSTTRWTNLDVEVGAQIPLDVSKGMLSDGNRTPVSSTVLVDSASDVTYLIAKPFRKCS